MVLALSPPSTSMSLSGNRVRTSNTLGSTSLVAWPGPMKDWPPKPGLPKLPSEPLPSLKLEKVRVKTKSEVYEPLTERETTGGMARGLARDDTVSSLY